MSDKQYVVALKVSGRVSLMTYGGYTYMKARPVDDKEVIDMVVNGELLHTPKKGSRYITCNLITSPVVDFERFRNGWEVQTENSLYRFFITNMDEIGRIAEENGFSGPRRINDVVEAFYWD